MIRLQEWAAARRARGGAPIKVRVVKGANLPMERVDADVHDWPLATWGTKQDSDTNYKRVLDYALHPERSRNVRHRRRRTQPLRHRASPGCSRPSAASRAGIEFEMLLGMAQGQAEVVQREVGGLLLYTPVVHPREFDVAIAYLIRRLEEGARSDNFMSAVFELDRTRRCSRRETRPLPRLACAHSTASCRRPTACRTARSRPRRTSGTASTTPPDTDPSLPANTTWGRGILSRVADSTLGVATDDASGLTMPRPSTQRSTVRRAAAAGVGRARRRRARGVPPRGRRARGAAGRAARGDGIGGGQDARPGRPRGIRGDRLRQLLRRAWRASSTRRRRRLHTRPADLVTPPWNFPVAIPAGSTLSALAAGSAVVIKPARQARAVRRGDGRGALGGGRPAGRAPARAAQRVRPRQAARRRPAGRPGDPHRRLRDGRAVPLLPPGPAAARRDQRQERDHRDAERRPRPRRQGRRVLGVRPRRTEVLGGIPRHPGRIGRDLAAVPHPARRRRAIAGRRAADRPDHADGSDHRARQRQAARGPHDARPGESLARRARSSSTTSGARCGPPASATACAAARSTTSPSTSARSSASWPPTRSTTPSRSRTTWTTA